MRTVLVSYDCPSQWQYTREVRTLMVWMESCPRKTGTLLNSKCILASKCIVTEMGYDVVLAQIVEG